MPMNKNTVIAIAALALSTGAALAAPPDWAKVPAVKIFVVYPGETPIEWVTKAGAGHGGARAVRKGETCASCHHEDADHLSDEIVTGKEHESKPIKGKVGAIPVNVQAAHDGSDLYLRFSWKQPPGGGPKMDADNQVKLAFMLEDNKISGASQSGCWETCHVDSRSMPEAKDDKKTKYVKDGNLGTGVFYDLAQWTSKGGKFDGYVADKRVMEGGKALVDAKGEKKGDEWVVVFTRKFTGGEGDIALASGKTYNFGFAIHDDHTSARFHHVSLGYTLGIDAKADISAAKQ
jgi:Ethylbenzene dehydrogenase